MYDLTGNLHLHTTASDGTGTHAEVASAAARAGLDFIIYTDHNVWTEAVNGWYQDPATGREVLRLMGQEVNDPQLEPEYNHLLCHFVESDLVSVAANPQQLIDTTLQRGGLAFLAHPLERPGYGAATMTFPWINWDVERYTGIELWNAMTDVKWQLRTIPRGLLGAYIPWWVLNRPFPELLAKWDSLLAQGRKVVAIGNSDAHAWPVSLGPLTRVVFPYEFLFRAINTHVLLPQPLARKVATARQQLYTALQQGHCYVSNDLLGSPRGFSFTATSGNNLARMGDDLPLAGEAVLQVRLPRRATVRLLRNGQPVTETACRELTWRTRRPGVYRVEVDRWYWGWPRGWIYSNPIYIRD